MPVDGWLTEPRKNVYGKSRWDSSRDSAEFICWLMDYTGRDVMYSEGECTGGAARSRLTADMNVLTDEAATKRKYANADMYEPYPTFMCFTALKCSAQIADSIGQFEIANKWRNYAQRLHDGMIRLLASGDHTDRTWRISYNSIWPTPQDSLVQAFLAVYRDGFDPQKLDPVMTPITRNTLRHRIEMPSGYNAALGMGYGLGWQGMAALILDEMDDAGKILTNIARYSYDKNMDYYDAKRNIDWRQWLWLIPEGTNVLPDGRWHRIGDLSNGANQGNVIHAIEICVGVDDTDTNELKIMPRVVQSIQDINVANYKAVIKKSGKFTVIRLSYTYDRDRVEFKFRCSEEVPLMSVRLGPFSESRAHEIERILQEKHYHKIRLDQSGTFDGQPAWWIWLEKMENISEVSVKGISKN
ncbi:MAG: hypothetical protein A2Y13_00475 [Planctomycetes bacterium GWC2_45_44]|nr:MAG: hypothetical protein A2Y13_00475 [Planctomycetes bacterium GWC2_45_44]